MSFKANILSRNNDRHTTNGKCFVKLELRALQCCRLFNFFCYKILYFSVIWFGTKCTRSPQLLKYFELKKKFALKIKVTFSHSDGLTGSGADNFYFEF